MMCQFDKILNKIKCIKFNSLAKQPYKTNKKMAPEVSSLKNIFIHKDLSLHIFIEKKGVGSKSIRKNDLWIRILIHKKE